MRELCTRDLDTEERAAGVAVLMAVRAGAPEVILGEFVLRALNVSRPSSDPISDAAAAAAAVVPP